MGLAEGRNAGVTGLIDLPNQSAKFNVWARAWTSELTAAMLNAAGRGDSEWPELRPNSSGGFVTVGGSIRLDSYPLPTKFRGELGTLTITLNTGTTIVYPVRVVKETFNKPNKETGLWDVSLVCQIVGDVTAAGFGGTQPTAATETFSDKELWEGLSKTIDPQNLQNSAGQRYLVWGVGDNDSAEQSKINELLLDAFQPIGGTLKLRPATFVRVSKWVGYVSIAWAMTDTAEDVVNPATSVTVDPALGLANSATIAAINANPAAPSGAFVLRATSTRELHDSAELKTSTFGTRTTVEDRTMPGTFVNADPSDLKSIGQQTEIYSTDVLPLPQPTVPSGQQIVGTKVERVDQFNSQKVWQYGKDTNKQIWEQENSFTFTDPNGLGNKAQVAEVDATPPLPAGFVDRGVRRIQITNDHYGDVRECGTRSTIADITYPGSVDKPDPENLESTATRTDVAATATISTPPNVAGLKHRGTEHERIDDGHWKNTHDYALRNTREDHEYLKSKTVTEATAVKQQSVFARVTNSATPPGAALNPDTTNLSLYWAETTRLTDGLWLHIVEFRPLTVEEEIEEDASHTTTDQSTALAGDAQRAIVDGNATAPSGGSAPTVSGRVLQKVTTKRIGKAKYRHVYFFDFRTLADEHEAKQTRTRIDTSALDSDAMTADVWLISGGAPSTPTLAGFQLLDYEDREIENPLYRVRVYRWGLVTGTQKIEYDGTTAEANPLEYYKSSVATVQNDPGTSILALVQASLAANQGTLTYEATKGKRLTPDKWLRVIESTGADKLIHSMSSRAYIDFIRGKPASLGYGSTTALLNITWPQPPQPLVAFTYADTMGYYWGRHKIKFKLRRRFITSTPETYYYLDRVGQMTSSTFRGFPPNSVLYEGPEIVFTDSVSGAHLLIVDYLFEYDSSFHMRDSKLPSPGRISCLIPTFPPAEKNGDIPAQIFGQNYVMEYPPNGADFAVFTA